MIIPVPEEMRPLCVGVFVGGCISTGSGVSLGAQAHAHNDPDDSRFGWICFMGCLRVWIGGRRAFKDPSLPKRPSRVFWHEYAHLMVPGDFDHGRRWITVMESLGQPVQRQYREACS